ncbi:MAG TPA: 5-oxoprolinase subunit PxpB [Xanthobacteraceae bacterium]|jgi:KipI family sensor histidine kinase inhibitor
MLTHDGTGTGEPAIHTLTCSERADAEAPAVRVSVSVGGLERAADHNRRGGYRLLAAGDTALVVEFGERIDRRLSTQVLALARQLDELRLPGLIETVPSFRSLMVHFDPLVLSVEALGARIHALIGAVRITETAGRQWCLPVCYDVSLAPDLEDVAARAGMSPDEVVERHSRVNYYVYMLGFLPGMAYLGDLPPELALPRRANPRLKIPAGSLAIANAMTSILPQETPCGWHVIGRSPVAFFDLDTTPQALLAPGDNVRFTPVSLSEFENLSAAPAAERLRIVLAQGPIGAAA